MILINEMISLINYQLTECECDIKGSENQNCDSKTGKCPCKYGVVGDKCTKCSPDHFGFPNCKGTYNFIFVGIHFYFLVFSFFRAFLSSVLTYFSCLFTISDICKCNAEGSKDIDCNSQGLCECICNVVGPNCDKCAPGFYQFPNCKRKYTQ